MGGSQEVQVASPGQRHARRPRSGRGNGERSRERLLAQIREVPTPPATRRTSLLGEIRSRGPSASEGYTDQIPEIPTLEALKNLTPYLAQDWTKQLIYLSKMRKLYLACVEAGIHGEEKWDEEHQRLHESTWPATREVIGLPPENIEALKTWRTSKPAPVYESKLEADLAPYVLQDYPEGETIPPHIGTWLSSRVASFEGL